VQDTGFSEFLPTGNGLFAFSTLEEAAAAIKEVESDYASHQTAAREIALEHFSSERVIGRMLQPIGLM
jgi:hypothetical protein